MVLMHRKDIIERYGFDPADSVVPKGEGPTAAINVVPDEEKIEPPSQETPHAGVGSSLAAGALKGLSSDPIGIYGLAAGLAWWGKEKLKGNSEASFTEGLYNEGGLEQIKSHLEQRRQQLKTEHPDWNEEAVSDELTRYAATPEFFEFNTGQMTPALRSSLRLAYDINKATGVDKTPFQENFSDDTLQTLGSILTPGGFLKVGTAAQKFVTKAASKVTNEAIAQTAGKVAKGVGNVVDWTIVPGTTLAPGQVAGNLAGGVALDEAQRQVMGDPTVLPSGEALGEYFKNPQQVPMDQAVIPTPDTLTTAQREMLVGSTQEAGMGMGATLAGASILGGLGLRHAFRGRVAPSVPPIDPNTPSARMEIRRQRETGFNPEADPNPVHRAIEYVDEKGDLNAPAFQLGRELGVEQELQAELGQFLTPHGQQLTLKNVWEDGILPSGERTVPLQQRFDIHAAAAPDMQVAIDEALKGLNILSEVGRARQNISAEMTAAHGRVLKSPNDPAAVSQFADLQRRHKMWSGYEEAVRHYEPSKDEGHWQNAVNRVMSDPDAIKLLENYKGIVDTTNRVLVDGGVISPQEYTRRTREEPYHIALYEYDPKVGQKYDPTKSRNDHTNRTDQPVDTIDPPMATARQSFEIAARAASNTIGRRHSIQIIRAADPDGKEIKVLPAHQAEGNPWGHKVEFRDENANPMVALVNRKHVADVLNQAPIDDGIGINILNSVRNASQVGMVHAAAGLYQAPVSLFYNIVTGFLGQKSGVSLGYLSRWIRSQGQGPIIGTIADIADFVPDRLVAYGITAIDAAHLRMARDIGARMATQAITQDGLFGLMARTLPNGEQVVADFGARLSAYHAASWMAHYQRWGESGAHPAVFDKTSIRDNMAADLKRWSAGTPRGVLASWGGLRPIWNGYTSVLNHIASLHNMTQVAQNVAVREAQLGRSLRLNESRDIVEAARISAGDMSAQPGGTVLRRAGKLIPFFRIGLASSRYLLHAMTSRGAWDSGMVVARMGAVAGAMYASTKVIEELGLTDWYYEQLNDFERNGKLRLLKLEHQINKTLGRQLDLDMQNPDNNFYILNLPQEASLFLGTIMYGLEQAGFINRGSNRGNTSAEKDMVYAALQTFNVGNIPAASVAGPLLFGKKIDLTAGLRGREPIADIKGSKGQLGDMPSGIPSVPAEIIKSLFGFTGQLALSATDAGIQTYKKTHDAVQATARGWEEAKSQWVEKTVPSVPGLWDGARKHYAFTQMSSETSRMMGVSKELNDAYTNNFTAGGAKRGENRKRVADPEIKMMLAISHAFFDRGGLPKMQERLTYLRNQVDNLAASKGERSYEEVKDGQEKLYRQMRPWHERMADTIQKYERLLERRYGERFRAEGLEPNVDNVVKLVRKYSS